jgi:hypothetical protein
MFTSFVLISILKHTNRLSNLVLFPEIVRKGDMKLGGKLFIHKELSYSTEMCAGINKRVRHDRVGRVV